jgi:hypothetical protein
MSERKKLKLKKEPRTFKLGQMEIELLLQLKECGVPMAEAVREAIRAYVPYLLEQCERRRAGRA